MNEIIKSILSKSKGGMPSYFDAKAGRDTSELMSSRGGAEPVKPDDDREAPEWEETVQFQKAENEAGVNEAMKGHGDYDPSLARMKYMGKKYGGQ